MLIPRQVASSLVLAFIFSALGGAQTWTLLTHQPTFNTDTALLLTDGTVMMHQYNSTNWWRLTPDNTGSYVNGTWSQLASMQSGYQPLYFASAVMTDGRVLVEGGEYNNLVQDETNQGAIYDPASNTWTTVNPPTGWSTIGDSPSVILPNGTFMMGQGGQPAELQVLFNASTLTWTAITNTGKADGFSEEGFALLPNGDVLTVDTEDGTNSELYNPSTEKWTNAGSTIVVLPNNGGMGIVPEMGPLMQRPNGTVVAFGATTHTSVYNTASGTWTAGPDFPNGDDMADAPASLLPDGNVLVYTSPGVFSGTGTFYEFNGTTFTSAPSTASSGSLQSYQGRLLLLPTGQVLYAVANGQTIDVEAYTPSGTYQSAWQPTITSVASTLTPGSTNNVIEGTQFNGLSQGSMYGDDAQMATNYPLVRIKNNSTGHEFYAKTHNHSTMGIATGSATVSTEFDIPFTIESGASTLVVVANGIPSNPASVTIESTNCTGAPTCLVLDYYDLLSPGFSGDNVHVSNLSSSGTDVAVVVTNSEQGLYVPSDSDEHLDFPGAAGGPVFITGSGSLTSSQRVFYYSAFSEVYAQSSAAASTQLWLNWYDQHTAGFSLDDIHLANPSGSAVTATVTFGANTQNLTVPANGIAIANFPSQIGGPVSITASGPILASARTEYYQSFNEVNAVPVSQASTKLEFSWYDQYDAGFSQDNIHISNPGTSSATVTVSLGGVVKDTVVVGAKAEAVVNLGSVLGGPLTISSNVPVIASQRVLYDKSFNEVYAVPASLANTQLVLNWYDQSDPGFTAEFVHLVNPSTTTATVTVKLGSNTDTITVPAGGAAHLNFPGNVGGPVFITSTVPVLASARTEYYQSFNEVNAVPVP